MDRGSAELARPARSPLLYRILAFPLFIAAFGSLPRMLDFGAISAMGVLTIVEVGVAAAGLVACRQYPRWLLLRVLPYFCFLAWATLSTTWAPPQTGGIQNGLVYLLFGLMVLFSSTLAARDPERIERLIDRGVLWISCVSLAIVALEVSVRGTPTDTEDGWLIGPRPLAILGVVMISRYLARWYHGDKKAKLWILLWIGAILVSLSRSAAATALVLVGVAVFAQLRFRRRRAVLTLPAALGAIALTVVLAVSWTPFRERMFSGDTQLRVGATPINVSGRLTMWTAVVQSGLDRPLVGNGLGSAQAAVTEAFAFTPSGMTQPHDDYLRIWHDLGMIGLALYLAAVGSWMWMLGRGWYASELAGTGMGSLEFAGLLALLGLSLVEITDNPVVYQAVMGPAGLLIGAGLGVRMHNNGSILRIPSVQSVLVGTSRRISTRRA